jgi:PAS domain S-box-containing protein
MTGSDNRRSAKPLQPGERSRQIVDGLAEGYVSFDADWRFTDCNRTAERLFRRKREDLLGSNLCDISGLAGDSPFAALAQRVADTRTPEDAELSFRSGVGSRLLSVRAFPLAGGVGAVWRDITAARAAERRLALSEARYREIADGVPAAAWLSRAGGKLEFINQAMVDALGWPRRDLLGDGWTRCIDPEDRPRLLAARSQARADHSSFHYEGRFRRPDGALRVIQLYGRPRFDAMGAFRGHVGIAADVTEAREHERQQQLLINELNHRVKNSLATVQSLVRHTIRDHGVPKEVEHAVTERLVALSAAHDVLSRKNWEGAELTEIIGEVLRPYDHRGRISKSGPRVQISPKTAIALSIGLQEMATNAAKYGALSTPDGRVRVNWTRNDGGVEIEWRESGGPRVTTPEPSGFGSVLLNRVLPAELGHAVELVHAPEGVICRLHAPTLDCRQISGTT